MEAIFKIKMLVYIIFLAIACHGYALPTDKANISNKSEDIVPSQTEEVKENSSVGFEVQSLLAQNETKPAQETDLETSESEHKEQTLDVSTMSVEPNNEAADSNFDPSIYGGLITPNAFQQYVNQFGAAFPYAAPYPAPVYAGYIPPPPPPVYPSPYIVQTGYEGYIVPSETDSTTSTTSNSAGDLATSNSTTPLLHSLTLLNKIISTLMMSTIFRIVAGIVSTIGMVIFSGTIMNFMCNYTPLCDMSIRAVSYLRRKENAERMGRMIAEGMTPKRVERASEFVHNAIKLYQDLQETTKKSKNHKQ